MEMRRLLLFYFVICLFSSCYRIALQKVGALDSHSKILTLTNSRKQVAFIPMHHIGKISFYSDVKRAVDSLKTINYVFYYEGVIPDVSLDSLSNDTLAMKMRRAFGFDVRKFIASKGYVDTATSTFLGQKRKFVKKLKLVNQPRNSLYLDTSKRYRADVTYRELVVALESRLGEIVLDSCDYKTRFSANYYCNGPGFRNKGRKAMLAIRDSVLAEKILNEPSLHIGVVYGAAHFDGVYKYLKSKDSSWTRKN